MGRKSLGSLPKGLVCRWLENASDAALLEASIGNDPSLADVLKMVRPKPADAGREAFYGYVLGKPHQADALPEAVQAYEGFKRGLTRMVPKVPFQMLASLDLDADAWTAIAMDAGWQMTRMNLNTFARHGVLKDKGVAQRIAARLKDPAAVAKARVFPYQLLAAYASATEGVPDIVRDALQDAMELALGNVPEIAGQVYVCPDVSGSMSSPVTGGRGSATTLVRCIDVAGLMAAAVLRKNPEAKVLPFAEGVKRVRLNARDTVLTNAARLAALGGGGTDCSQPLAHLNRDGAKGDLVIYVSDNESWMDAGRGRGTGTMAEWTAFKARNPGAKLVCIDIQPGATTQAQEREDILNVGGFSDQVFTVVADFAAGRLDAGHLASRVREVEL